MSKRTGKEYRLRIKINPVNIPKNLRKLYIVQRGLCAYCGTPLSPTTRSLLVNGNDPMTRDHVRPASRKNPRHKNIVAAHSSCNKNKDDRDPHPCELFYLEIVNEIRSGLSSAKAVRILKNPELLKAHIE